MPEVEVADGTSLFYSEAGHGPTTLLIPGACWLEKDLADLADTHRVVFYDQRNRGRSQRSDRISIDQEVEDLEAVRVALELGRVVTLGWSYLGAVVALHARSFPSSVGGVVMVSPMAPRQGVPEYNVSDQFIEDYRQRWAPVAERIAELDRSIEEADDPLPFWRERQRVNSAFRMGDPRAVERMKSEPWRFPNERAPQLDPVFAALFDGLEQRDWRQGLERVTAPALIFHGLADGPAAMSQDWQQAFPDARGVFMEAVGHFPFLEDPDTFRDELSAFLSELD